MMHRGSRRQGRGGFSLVELVVAIGIFALFTLTLSRLMLGGMQTFKRGEAITSLRQDIRQALDLVTADFRQSTTNVTTPAYASGKNRSLTLTFQRNILVGTAVQLHTISYTLDGTTNRLTRTDLTDNQAVLVASNVLVGTRLGESTSADLSASYFVWSINPSLDVDRDYGTMEVRLTGLNQEQRLSMVTQISQRADIASLTASLSLPPAIALLPATDLRPVAPRRLRPARPGGKP